jgi:hypothetical protein
VFVFVNGLLVFLEQLQRDSVRVEGGFDHRADVPVVHAARELPRNHALPDRLQHREPRVDLATQRAEVAPHLARQAAVVFEPALRPGRVRLCLRQQ